MENNKVSYTISFLLLVIVLAILALCGASTAVYKVKKVFNTKEGLQTLEQANVECIEGYGSFDVVISSTQSFTFEKEALVYEAVDTKSGFYSLTLPANGISCTSDSKLQDFIFTVQPNESKNEQVLLEITYTSYFQLLASLFLAIIALIVVLFLLFQPN